jgi:hypothetical protein
MFDSSQIIPVTIKSGGRKSCKVKFPSDEQWAEYVRKQRSIRRQLGRGKSQVETLGVGRAELDLFNAIRQDEGGETFSEADAVLVINQLQRAEILSSKEETDGYQIQLKVRGGYEVAFALRMPSALQVMDYEKAATQIINERRTSEYRVSLDPGGRLFDSLVKADSVSGYQGAVPIIHKCAAIAEMVELYRVEDQDDPEA